MGIILKDEGPKYEPIPEDTYMAVCSRIIDLGKQVTGGEFSKVAPQLRITWEIPSLTIEVEDEHKGKITVPREFSQKYNVYFNEQAKLRQHLEAWRGRAFTDDELAGFDIDDILGKTCQIQIYHKKSANGRVYAKLKGIMALPKGIKPLDAPKVLCSFELSHDTLDQIELLREWEQKEIKAGITYQELTGGTSEVNQGPFHDDKLYTDDEMPF